MHDSPLSAAEKNVAILSDDVENFRIESAIWAAPKSIDCRLDRRAPPRPAPCTSLRRYHGFPSPPTPSSSLRTFPASPQRCRMRPFPERRVFRPETETRRAAP